VNLNTTNGPFRRTGRRLVIPVVLALVTAGLAAGCGDDDSTAAGDGEDKAQVYFLIPSLSNDAYIGLRDGAEFQAKEEADVADVTVDAPSTGIGEASRLIPKVESAITRGVDVIAVNSGAAQKELTPVLKQAIDAGIDVITNDVDIPELDRVSYIAIDEPNTSPAAGELIKEQLPDGGKLFILSCVVDHPVTVARTEGFEAGLEGWKGEIVGTGDSECDEEKARTIMENAITSMPDLDAVYSTTAQATEGGLKALEAASKDLLFVSHDATKGHGEEIQQGGILDADVINPFQEIGALVVKTAVEVAEGEEVPEEILVEGGLVTKDTAASFLDELKKYEGTE
jgi:ABC-type sugar transport system substrate-binding protein